MIFVLIKVMLFNIFAYVLMSSFICISSMICTSDVTCVQLDSLSKSPLESIFSQGIRGRGLPDALRCVFDGEFVLIDTFTYLLTWLYHRLSVAFSLWILTHQTSRHSKVVDILICARIFCMKAPPSSLISPNPLSVLGYELKYCPSPDIFSPKAHVLGAHTWTHSYNIVCQHIYFLTPYICYI